MVLTVEQEDYLLYVIVTHFAESAKVQLDDERLTLALNAVFDRLVQGVQALAEQRRPKRRRTKSC